MNASCMALVVDAVIAASSEECGSRFASAVSSTTAGEEATAGMNAPSATGCTTRGRGSGPFQGLMCTPRAAVRGVPADEPGAWRSGELLHADDTPLRETELLLTWSLDASGGEDPRCSQTREAWVGKPTSTQNSWTNSSFVFLRLGCTVDQVPSESTFFSPARTSFAACTATGQSPGCTLHRVLVDGKHLETRSRSWGCNG